MHTTGVRLRRRVARALVLPSALAGLVGVFPAGAEAASRAVTVKVFDSSGTTLLHQHSATIDTNDFLRFAVATHGFNDSGSMEGQVAIDDLTITDVNNSQSTWSFSSAPAIIESTTGGTEDALRYDAGGQRLLGIGDSGYACSNYESINPNNLTIKKARFTIRRITGDVGDGSYWNMVAGVVPSDSETVVGGCGRVDNMVGVTIEGDGDGIRNSLRGHADGTDASTAYGATVNTTYVVEIDTGTTGGPTSRTVSTKVFDSSGTTLLHQHSATITTNDFRRFAVATHGFNDSGSMEGQVAIDDLTITDVNNSQSTWSFSSAPAIIESTTGGTEDALRYDAGGQRLLGIGDSGYACSNYESINPNNLTIKKARFTIRRITGDVGDGSYWNMVAGVVPSDSETVVGGCGRVDNMVGVTIEGDGDGIRNSLRGHADGTDASTAYGATVNTTYVVEIDTGGGSPPPPCGNPTAGLTPSSQNGVAPYNASFSLSGSAASGCSITGYTLAFGDNTNQPGSSLPATVSHTYANPGTYTATLTVNQSDGKTATATGTVVVSGPSSGNDNFANATHVSFFPFTDTVTTTNNTTQSGEPTSTGCGTVGKTAWYRLAPDATFNVTADTVGGTNFDTVIAVWSGTSLTGLTSVTCNDQIDGTNQSRVNFTARAGTTYYIQVGGWNGGSGTYQLDVTGILAPSYDAFETPIVIGSSTFWGSHSTAGTSRQAGEPSSCTTGQGTIWFRYTHPSSQTARRLYADTFGSNFDTTLAVFQGTSITGLTQLGCNNNVKGVLQSQTSWVAQPGVTYHLQLAGVGSATGLSHLSLHEGHMVALGDSIVAGHGVGPSPHGYPNNPTGAYSQIIANDLKMHVGNMARTGSCAGNNNAFPSTGSDPRRFTPESCDNRSILADQMSLPVVTPTHVIVGVGGNDIEFAACIAGFIKNNADADLCRGTTLDNRLAALSKNLDEVLRQMNLKSNPSPHITVVGYYNPFPDAPVGMDVNHACDMWMPAAIGRNNNLAAQDHESATFRQATVEVQREAYAYAQDVVTKLNNTLRNAATARGARFVETAPSFVDHDMCRMIRGGSAADTWVYGPDWEDDFFIGRTFWRHYDSRPMPGDCPHPSNGDDEITMFEFGFGYSYSMTFRPNCLPHPTPQGQQALANIVKPQLHV